MQVVSDVTKESCDFILFSASCFMQVKQGQVEVIMQCSIPKLFVKFTSFHGVFF